MNHIDIHNKMVILVGKRGPGKSIQAKYILENTQEFDRVKVVCPTESMNGFYKTFLDTKYFFDSWNEKYITELFSAIEKENAGKNKDKMKKIMLILDDMVGDFLYLS